MIRETCLRLDEVQEAVVRLESKYGITSVEFLRNAQAHPEISEDDVFSWGAFLDHKAELESAQQRFHTEYLLEAIESSSEKTSATIDLVELAA